MHPPPELMRHWRTAAASAGGTALVLCIAAWLVYRRRPTAEQMEQRRRLLLSAHGRIVDGVLLGAEPSERQPAVLLYTYRVAGVTYECSQDVTALPGLNTALHLEFPVQVLYERNNPANSIVVSESWNGLWNSAR